MSIPGSRRLRMKIGTPPWWSPPQPPPSSNVVLPATTAPVDTIFVDDLRVDTRRTDSGPRAGLRVPEEPLVEAMPAVPEPVPRSFVRSRDEPVEGHRHVEHGC